MNIKVEFNIPAAMRDGTTLRANVFRPDDGGAYPVALMRTPYGKDFATVSGYLDAVRLASAGYIVVIQDTRGRFASEGAWAPFVHEASDGYDTVAWAARLPGSDGHVGMVGASYVGFTQWAAASQKPPQLKALVPGVTWADYRDGLNWRGGAFELGSAIQWLLFVGIDALSKQVAHLPRAEQVRALAALVYQIDHLRPDGYLSLPLKGFAPLRQPGLMTDLLEEAIARPNSRDYGAPYSPAAAYDRLTVPACNIGGWYDIFCAGTLQNFTALRGHGSKLLIGPWDHGGPNNVVGEMDFGFAAGGWINLQFDLTDLTRRWFDRWLKGIDNGISAEPPIKLFVMGENVWRDEHTWPLARTEYTPMYLRQGGALAFDPPGSDEPADHYTYDPADPTPTWGGALLLHPLYGPGVRDQRRIAARPDVLSYTSAPLDRAVEVTGPVTVTLWAASDARDTDFVARLIDVQPDGFARNLCDGIIRARYRNGDTPALLQPGQPCEYAIDLWATSNLFAPGHCIRLDIASASFPRWDRNPNTGDDFGLSAAMQPARQTILHDANHPSRVVLPVIPRG